MKTLFTSLIILSILRGTIITVTYDSVNIRHMDGSATGLTAAKGETLSAMADNSAPEWLLITSGEFKGMKIWRGCTSNALNYTCHQKRNK